MRARLLLLVIFTILVVTLTMRLTLSLTGGKGLVDAPLSEGAVGLSATSNRAFRGAFSFLEVFRLPSHLKREAQLEGEIALLNAKLALAKGQLRESENLRKLLGVTSAPAFRTIPARVIARTPELWFEGIIISGGQNDGIRQGDLVVDGVGVIGEVSEVFSSFSKVRLLTSPDFAVGAICASSQIEGVARGNGPGLLRLEYVPASSAVRLREKVLTSGLGLSPESGKPSGFLLGYVAKVRRIPGITTLEILLEPATSGQGVRNVIVLTRK